MRGVTMACPVGLLGVVLLVVLCNNRAVVAQPAGVGSSKQCHRGDHQAVCHSQPPPHVYQSLLNLHPIPHPRGYVALRASTAPTIDGHLDDDPWRAAPWSKAFVDITGDPALRPALDTRVKMLWDDEHLYVGAHLEEPHPWATLTLHDSVVFHDNDFEIFIDPDGDNAMYYEVGYSGVLHGT